MSIGCGRWSSPHRDDPPGNWCAPLAASGDAAGVVVSDVLKGFDGGDGIRLGSHCLHWTATSSGAPRFSVVYSKYFSECPIARSLCGGRTSGRVQQQVRCQSGQRLLYPVVVTGIGRSFSAGVMVPIRCASIHFLQRFCCSLLSKGSRGLYHSPNFRGSVLRLTRRPRGGSLGVGPILFQCSYEEDKDTIAAVHALAGFARHVTLNTILVALAQVQTRCGAPKVFFPARRNNTAAPSPCKLPLYTVSTGLYTVLGEVGNRCVAGLYSFWKRLSPPCKF